MREFEQQYDKLKQLVETALQDIIKEPETMWPDPGIPRQLALSMRYSLLAGGKRLRPVILLAAYQANREDVEAALPFALAVEMIHTYSLIHDDLPAMDDDDLRRGKPTNHKVYGEAMAILAGDALLTMAFELMSSSTLGQALQAIHIIASRAGATGMIAGQTADLLSANQDAGKKMVHYIHQHKTADLIIAPMLAGLTLAGADDRQKQAGLDYASNLGLAFQITDDLLDITGNPEMTGKQGRRDAALGKLTWPGVAGLQQAQEDAQAAIDRAVAAAEHLGKSSAFFRSLALSVTERVK